MYDLACNMWRWGSDLAQGVGGRRVRIYVIWRSVYRGRLLVDTRLCLLNGIWNLANRR